MTIIGAQAKVATSHGRPVAVALELLDGTSHPHLLMLTRAEARQLSAELLRASDRVCGYTGSICDDCGNAGGCG